MSDTEIDFQRFTKDWAHRLRPLDPIATEAAAHTEPLTGVRAILFDIYGTLLISQSGDVDITRFDRDQIAGALPGIELLGEPQQIIDGFVGTIKTHHERSPHPFPEVDIVEVWREAIEILTDNGVVRATGPLDPRRIAYAFEIVNNAVWAMPGLVETLRKLDRAGYPLGIVSNAQFFTPVLLRHFLDDWWPFQEDLTVYSFELMRAKPDPYLYRKAVDALAARGINAEQSVFVGNDMLNDIYASHQVGLKTILFAGDSRSLRMRRDHPELEGLTADRVVSRLGDLSGVLGI